MTRHGFRQLRKELGLSQAQLAAAMGTTKASVSRWEAGERPISELAARFLTLLVQTQGKRTQGKRTGGR